MRKLTMSALLICLPGILVADIYRWVDSRGVVNYTQQKPNNVAATLVGQATQGNQPARAPTPEPVTPAATANTNELNAAQQAKLEELRDEEEQRAIALAERQEENCNQAQTTLEQLTTSTRIRVRADDGTVRAIPEEERLSRIEQTQLAIAENCV